MSHFLKFVPPLIFREYIIVGHSKTHRKCFIKCLNVLNKVGPREENWPEAKVGRECNGTNMFGKK